MINLPDPPNLAYAWLATRIRFQAACLARFSGVRFRVRRTHYQLRSTLKHRAIEPVLSGLLNLCDQDTLFLDIGANIGLFSLLIAAERSSTCIAFEPVRSTFASLVENCRLNPLLNITALNLALGECADRVEISSMPESGINTIQPEEGYHGRQTQAAIQLSLDQLNVADLAAGSNRIVMKIDVERYELAVLRGARNSLAINRPIALCIEAESTDVDTIQELLGDGFQKISPSFYPHLNCLTELDSYNHFFVNWQWINP